MLILFILGIILGIALWLDKHPMVVAAVGSVVAWLLVLALITGVVGVFVMLNDRSKNK